MVINTYYVSKICNPKDATCLVNILFDSGEVFEKKLRNLIGFLQLKCDVTKTYN